MFHFLESLEPRMLLSSGPASPNDMEIIWRVNQARANPTKFAKFNKMPAAVKTIARQQPLAVNSNLVKAAQFRALEMANNDYFAHQSQVTGKWPNEIARDNGYALDNSFANAANNIESIFGGFPASPQRAVNALIEDKGVNPPGHRIHLLATDAFFQSHTEIGAGFKTNNSATLRNYVSILTGFRDSSDVFLTGVAYTDKNKNKRYDAGEGIKGLTVNVDGVAATKTGKAGGYSVETAAGAHAIALVGRKAPTKTAANVNVGTDNIAIDFVGNARKPIQINFAGTSFRPTEPLAATTATAVNTAALATAIVKADRDEPDSGWSFSIHWGGSSTRDSGLFITINHRSGTVAQRVLAT